MENKVRERETLSDREETINGGASATHNMKKRRFCGRITLFRHGGRKPEV